MKSRGVGATLKAALLFHPYQLPLCALLAVLALVFTVWPDALEHAPIAFEKRGVVHHVWHYSLLLASLVTLYGMLFETRRRLQLELAGLLGLSVVVALNTIALSADVLNAPPGVESGLGLALRYGILIGFGARLYTIVWKPTINVTVER